MQRDPEWFAARVGKVTASRLSDVLAGGSGKTRENYIGELVAERMTGKPYEGFQNGAMERGIELESDARTMYDLQSDDEIVEVDFVPHPTIEMAGASPDALVGAKGLAEYKCPKTSIHIRYLLGGAIPNSIYCQMQWQLACTEREFCDFSSYDPRMESRLALYVRRVDRDQAFIDKAETAVKILLAEVDMVVEKLRGLM